MPSTHQGYIGDAFRAFAVGDLEFGWWSTRACGKDVPEHEHEHAHVMYACAGDYRSRAAGAGGLRQPIVFNPAGTVHRDRFETPGLFFSLSFRRSPEELLGAEAPRVAVCAGMIEARAIIGQMAMLSDEPGPERNAVAECLAAELMLAFGRTNDIRPRPQWLRRIAEIVSETPVAPRLRELASEARVHPYHLAASFRRFYGCTPAQYGRNLRVERSLGALTSSNAPIAEIAADYGFSDQSHFTRAVSAMFGVGPAELRRRLS